MLDPKDLYLPWGSTTDGVDPVCITPEQAGWHYTGLRVLTMDPGARREFDTGDYEMVLLPISGCGIDVDVDGESFGLSGRQSVFSSVSDFIYVPRDSHVVVTAPEGEKPIEVAVPMAVARRRIDPYHVAADSVPVEIRGAGVCTRQLNNFLAPGVNESDRLVAVEVLTPQGNWSSYPPHKHDTFDPGSPDGEAQLEEIYWYRIAGGDAGYGIHRTYDLEQDWSITRAVADRDAFLVPRGYHGPCIAAPGYDMYYLNVLAGPGEKPSLAFSDDPAHAWVRQSWSQQVIDDRVPMTTASKVVAR